MCIWISLYLICVRDSKGRVCAFLTWYVCVCCVCVCVYPHAKGSAGGHNVLWLQRRRKVRLCVWERANASHAAGGPCAFWLQCEDRQMSRWRSGGGECGGLWVMPDFSALYAPHAFILHMLQTNATLHQLLCSCEPKVLCVFKKSNLLTYILQSELGWAVISHAQMLRWSFVQQTSSAGVWTAPHILSDLFSSHQGPYD